MSELILFTLNGIVIYAVSDWLLRVVEKRRGSAFRQRQVIFFAIFLVLALVSFRTMKMVLGDPQA